MSRLISLKTYALRPASVNLIFPQNFNLRKVGTWLYSIGARRIRKNCQTRRGRRSSSVSADIVRALHKKGFPARETPRDIAFVSFDEVSTDDFFHPGVTCVLEPTFDIGYCAVEVLLNRIEKGKAEGRPAKIRLPATLVVRESSESARPCEACPGCVLPCKLPRSLLQAVFPPCHDGKRKTR